ncbi:MAG: hypothetical protein WCO57_14240, partial [Verrucomicrobiota bacterium]
MKYPLLAPSPYVRLCAMIITTLLLSQALHATPLRILAWNDEIAGRKLAIVDAKSSVTIEAMHPS